MEELYKIEHLHERRFFVPLKRRLKFW